jgi:hypothetical protein
LPQNNYGYIVTVTVHLFALLLLRLWSMFVTVAGSLPLDWVQMVNTKARSCWLGKTGHAATAA